MSGWRSHGSPTADGRLRRFNQRARKAQYKAWGAMTDEEKAAESQRIARESKDPVAQFSARQWLRERGLAW